MRKRLSAAILCLLVIAGLALGAIPAYAETNTVGEIDHLIDGIVAYKENEAGADDVQAWLDGTLTEEAGTTAEWYVMALSRYIPELDFTRYADAFEAFLIDNNVASATSRQRYALTLIACGRENSDFVQAAAGDSIGQQGVMSWIYGLHLLNNGVSSASYTAGDAIGELLSLRIEDGGWALTGEHSDVDVTAMTVQALAPYDSVNDDVHTAIDEALDFLAAKQLEDGGYQSYGTCNPESCAQVIVALSSVGIDPFSDERFMKNGHTLLDGLTKYRLDDGSFCHTEGGDSNHTATVQAFYSLIAAKLCCDNTGRLYIFDESKVPVDAARGIEWKPRETGSETPQPEIEAVISEQNGKLGYKLWACIILAGLVLLACIITRLRGKRSFKNTVFIIVIGLAAAAVVLATNFQTRDAYYTPAAVNKPNAIGSVTMTIRCDTIVGKKESEYIPSDGVILPLTEFQIEDGDTVFDILVEAARTYSIQMENEGSAAGAHGMVYISGIHYLYEFDFGDLSGWVYRVNGVSPSVGCGDYTLSDGDRIEWLYTCDLGNDVK